MLLWVEAGTIRAAARGANGARVDKPSAPCYAPAAVDQIALLIFVLTYLGVALGEVPGLALDRTGFALLGALAMVVFGVVTPAEATAGVDVPTIVLLYSLMVVSAQFRLGGFYTRLALSLTAHLERPRWFLAKLMLASAVLSAVLANDIVCLAFTPVLTVTLLRAGRQPLPYLLGLAMASNIGSAATIIGNPQNMLIGQVGRLDFGPFLAWCGVPAALGLIVAYGLLLVLHPRAWGGPDRPPEEQAGDWPAFDAWHSGKGAVVTLALMASFFTPVPREVSGLAAAGLLLCSRRLNTRSLLGLVDWHLITLFIGLFVVVHAVQAHGWPAALVAWLAGHGWNLADQPVLAAVSVVLSNLVSNVPATMLLVKFLPAGDPGPWYVLAVSSTFAGNLVTIGSIANLITMEQARVFGVRISFRDHARAGIPVTLATLLVLFGWMALAR